MKKQYFLAISLSVLLGLSFSCAFGQDTPATRRNKKEGGYLFTVLYENGSTDVADQAQSSTCWSYSTESFIESELMRLGKGRYNLSEMFVVHQAYMAKSERYVRMHGNLTYAPGGAFHDAMYVLKNFGAVPEAAYPGLKPGEEDPDHNEMDAVLESVVRTVVKTPSPTKKPSPVWKNAVKGVLSAYLGEIPDKFEYEGKTYTPLSFAASLGINPDDYVEISSFSHHPFYEKFVLEVPDNWVQRSMNNVPLDELVEIVDNALLNGHTVAWGADVSEPAFSQRNGVAVVPVTDVNTATAEEKAHFWDQPRAEQTITQEIRQKAFNDYSTLDDHGMHIVGLAKDQNGAKYYIVKNSWGKSSNQIGGYIYVSETYFRYKTIDIMVHKGAVPNKIAKKIGL